ncbi:imidazole glycerol phosphate synthase subunit HisH [Luminiphilus sp.]|nr:imidazole glycerol phosphate synthase subunit HisH [Luminiphilus sp.]MDB2313494.1 imidazole glycerol phosphate synthase subunit HisH [Luminiphilus sp.]
MTNKIADISIVDYGVSNVGSIQNMLRKIGFSVEVISSPEKILSSKKIILPGVGSFDNGMSALEGLGLVEAIKVKLLSEKTPFLGICLGMQLLSNGSEEGIKAGLGIIPGKCVKIRPAGLNPVKVPHMGWNVPVVIQDNVVLGVSDKSSRFYFTHSYHFVCENQDNVIAIVDHGANLTAMVQQKNVFGVQFHPEKSHRFGISILTNFGRL